MHPLLRVPYRAVAALADAATALVAPAATGKLARAFSERRGAARHFARWGATSRRPHSSLLWMHAASVGEGLMARPLLERARADDLSLQLAYSWFSPSAASFAAGLGTDVAGMLPFDTEANAERMLDALAPTVLAFVRADVWPVLTERASARDVPVLLLSAALSAASSRGGWTRWALGDAYRALAAVGAVDADDAERLAHLGVPRDRITITGDTRYDQVLLRAAASDLTGPLLTPFAEGRAERPIVVAGSTWPADEAPLLRAWSRLAQSGRGARLIIAPHEPTEVHCAPIVRWAATAGLVLARLGAAEAATADVVLVDRVGVLGDLYAVATAAYVGGGFHGSGLHSMVEPAAFGVPVLIGPRHRTSRDAKRLLAAGGAVRVTDESSLHAALAAWLGNAQLRATASAAARTVVEAGRGATERSWALVRPWLVERSRA